MSKQLESLVWKSDLDAELKPVVAVMADMGNDDGFGIYPSVPYLAWLLSRSDRSIQTSLKKLASMSIVIRLLNAKGGRGMTPQYQLCAKNLPKRPSWQEVRKGADIAPFSETEQKGADFSVKGEVSDVKGEDSAPDPLVDPSMIRKPPAVTVKQIKPPPPVSADPTLPIRCEMLEFLADKIGALARPSREGKALKWLLEQNHSQRDCEACLEYLMSETWRTAAVTWVTVQNQIGNWERIGKPRLFIPKTNGFNGNGNGKSPPGENRHMAGPMSQKEKDERAVVDAEYAENIRRMRTMKK